MQVSFKGEVSKTKTKVVRKAYNLLIKLVELWNAYEVLNNYSSLLNKFSEIPLEVPGKKEKIEDKLCPYKYEFLQKIGSISLSKNILNTIKNNSKFKENFKNMAKKIDNSKKIKNGLKNYFKAVTKFFYNDNENEINENKIEVYEFIALIYIERNLYYHAGNTAKMGMDYSNRIFYLQTLIQGFEEYLLRLAITLMEMHIEALKKVGVKK